MKEHSPAEGLLAFAMGIIFNVGGGDWKNEAPEWRDAAKLLQQQYHAFLDKQIKEAMYG